MVDGKGFGRRHLFPISNYFPGSTSLEILGEKKHGKNFSISCSSAGIRICNLSNASLELYSNLLHKSSIVCTDRHE
jgi:hypothetical protein